MVDFFCTVFIVELEHAYKAIRRPQQNDCTTWQLYLSLVILPTLDYNKTQGDFEYLSPPYSSFPTETEDCPSW